MPFLLYLMLLSLVLLFQKQTRKFFFPFVFFISIIFLLAFNFNSKVRDNFKNLYFQINQMKTVILSNDTLYLSKPFYVREFSTFYNTWKLNKYIGGGIINFRFYCHIRDNINKDSKFVCNMHPHNYYLEILTETGLIGFALILIIFSITLYISLFKKYLDKSHLNSNHVITPFILLLITEIFPVKSTGSFFTTGNSTYFFIIFATVIALSRKDNFR